MSFRSRLQQTSPRELVVHLEGALTLDDARAAHDVLEALRKRPGLERTTVDFSAVESLNSVGAAAISHALATLQRAGLRVELRGLSRQTESAFRLVSLPEHEPASHPREAPASASARASTAPYDLAELLVDAVGSCLRVLLGREKLRVRTVVDQMIHLGANAVSIVLMLSFLTGIILAFQAAYQLRKFGAEPLMAEIVSLGMVREFGALMTAIILSGRSGSAIAAELGTMAVREELDALRTIGVDPVSFLVVPRVIAMTLVQPALTALSTGVGIAAGLITASVIGLPVPGMYARMQEALSLEDFWLALSKSLLFAWIIAFTGCYTGLHTRGGARSVGESTTASVVTSIFLIVVVDSIVTTLWTSAGHG